MADPANRSKEMVAKLLKKELNYFSFQRSCIAWMFEIWNAIGPEQFPEKPQEVLNHESIPYKDRAKLGADYYRFENTKVLPYYDERERVVFRNKGFVEHFRYLMEFCQNEEELAKFKGKIMQFEKAIAMQRGEIGVRGNREIVVNNIEDIAKIKNVY